MALRALIPVGQFPGSQTNDNAAAGNVGEFISALVGSGSAVNLTTATPANVTSISLTAGDWDVWGTIAFLPAGTTTITQLIGGTSTTSTTIGSFNNGNAQMIFASFAPGAQALSQVVPMQRLSFNATTTVFLVAQAAFATSTLAAYGGIFARRRR